MTLDEANRIVRIWGAYLEYCHDRLQALFIANIPESLLPYPPAMLEEALNIIAKHYHDIGDYDKSKLIQKSFDALLLYDNDEESIQGAAKIFNMPEVREAIISNMKKVRRNWIKTQVNS